MKPEYFCKFILKKKLKQFFSSLQSSWFGSCKCKKAFSPVFPKTEKLSWCSAGSRWASRCHSAWSPLPWASCWWQSDTDLYLITSRSLTSGGRSLSIMPWFDSNIHCQLGNLIYIDVAFQLMSSHRSLSRAFLYIHKRSFSDYKEFCCHNFLRILFQSARHSIFYIW